jgi:hypothetical protein
MVSWALFSDRANAAVGYHDERAADVNKGPRARYFRGVVPASSQRSACRVPDEGSAMRETRLVWMVVAAVLAVAVAAALQSIGAVHF